MEYLLLLVASESGLYSSHIGGLGKIICNTYEACGSFAILPYILATKFFTLFVIAYLMTLFAGRSHVDILPKEQGLVHLVPAASINTV